MKTAVMVIHVGGIDSIVETTNNVPNIPGGKKIQFWAASRRLRKGV